MSGDDFMKRSKTEYTMEYCLNGKKSTKEEIIQKFAEKYGRKREQYNEDNKLHQEEVRHL